MNRILMFVFLMVLLTVPVNAAQPEYVLFAIYDRSGPERVKGAPIFQSLRACQYYVEHTLGGWDIAVLGNYLGRYLCFDRANKTF